MMQVVMPGSVHPGAPFGFHKGGWIQFVAQMTVDIVNDHKQKKQKASPENNA